MNLRNLTYFVRVVEHGSFTRAAQRLRVAQPALTRHVHALEAQFGIELLVRGNRGVALTEAGQHLYECGVRILREVERTADEMLTFSGTPTGRIILGFSPSLCPVVAPALLLHQRRELPGIELKIVESFGQQLEDWLVERRIDLAVMTEPQDGRLLDCTSLGKEEMVLLAAPGTHDQGAISVEDLAEIPLTMTDSLRTIAERLLEPRGARLTVEAALNAIPTIVVMARAGLCSTIVPFSTARTEMAAGAVSVHRLTDEGVCRLLVLATLAKRRPSTAMQAITRLIVQIFQTLTDKGVFGPMSLPVR